MAHYVRERLAGAWAFNTQILQAELESWDDKITAAIHEGGGTWAPAAIITIGGAGMLLTGPLTVGGAFTATALTVTTTLTATTLTVTGNETVAGTLGVTGTLTAGVLAATTANVSGNATVGGTLGVTGITTTTDLVTSGGHVVYGNTTLGGTLAVTGVTTLASLVTTGALTQSGPANFSDPITLSGDGHIRKRRVAGADADTHYGVNTVDVVRVSFGALSANRIYTLDSTSAAFGSEIEITNSDGTRVVDIKRNSDGLTLFSLGTGGYDKANFYFDGTHWQLDRKYTN